MTLAPHSAFLIAQGLETLGLRLQRESDSALALAREATPVDDIAALAAGTGQHQNLVAFCGIARGGCSPLGRLIVRVRVDS